MVFYLGGDFDCIAMTLETSQTDESMLQGGSIAELDSIESEHLEG